MKTSAKENRIVLFHIYVGHSYCDSAPNPDFSGTVANADACAELCRDDVNTRAGVLRLLTNMKRSIPDTDGDGLRSRRIGLNHGLDHILETRGWVDSDEGFALLLEAADILRTTRPG